MGPNKITNSAGTGLTANGELRQYVCHSYNDLSMECDKPTTGKEEDMLHRYIENRVGGPFPLKLQIILKILEEEGNDCIMSWLPHGRAFVIHNSSRFEQEVVKRFFKHSQVSSFRRQLNLYGFLRLSNGRDSGGYYHESFLRGKPLFSLRMIRTKVKGTKIRASSSPADEPRFYGMSFLGPIRMNMNTMHTPTPQQSTSMGHIAPTSSFDQTNQLQSMLSDSISNSSVGAGHFPPTSRSFGQQYNQMMQQPQQASFNHISKQSPDIMHSSDFANMKGMNMNMDTSGPAGYGSNNLRTQSLLQRTLEQGRRDLMKANMLNVMNQKLEALNTSLATSSYSLNDSFGSTHTASNRQSLNSLSMMDLPSTSPRELAHKMAREHYFSQFDNALNQTSNFSKQLNQQAQYRQGQGRIATPVHSNMNSMMGDMMKSKMQIDAASAMVSLGSKMERRETSEISIGSNSTEEEKGVASTMMALGATIQQAV